MLTKQDLFFGWAIPKKPFVSNYGMRINKKYGYIYIDRHFLKELTHVNPESFRVAFRLNNTTNLLVFNPPAGIPYYNFSRNKSQSDDHKGNPVCYNKDLAIMISNKFANKTDVMHFRIEKYQDFDGMIFYQFVPLDKLL